MEFAKIGSNRIWGYSEGAVRDNQSEPSFHFQSLSEKAEES